MLVVSVVLVNIALIMYTPPIYNMFRKKTILKWHVIILWVGLCWI